MWEALSRGETLAASCSTTGTNGEGVPFAQLTVFPLKDAHQRTTHYDQVVRDVTEEHRRAHEQRARGKRTLAAAPPKNGSSERGHELHADERHPRHGGAAATVGLFGRPARADLATLRSSLDQMLTVISQLFDFTKLGDGAAEKSRVRFQLRRCLRPGARSWPPGGGALAPRASDLAAVPDVFRRSGGGLRQGAAAPRGQRAQVHASGRVRVQITRRAGERRPLPRALRSARHRHRHRGPHRQARSSGGVEAGRRFRARRKLRRARSRAHARAPHRRTWTGVAVSKRASKGSARSCSRCRSSSPSRGCRPRPTRRRSARPLASDPARRSPRARRRWRRHARHGDRAARRPARGVDAIARRAAIAIVRSRRGGVNALVLDERGGGFDAFAVAGASTKRSAGAAADRARGDRETSAATPTVAARWA